MVIVINLLWYLETYLRITKFKKLRKLSESYLISIQLHIVGNKFGSRIHRR